MSKTRVLTLTVAGLLLVVLVAGKMLKGANGDEELNAYSTVVPVSGFVLQTAPFTHYIEESGTLAGRRESVLGAETGGQIEQIYVEIGDVVKQGQALLKLDDVLLKLETERAKITFEKAQLDFNRLEKLYNENSVSESDYENARLGLKAAEVQYRAADKTSSDATIRAPFAGTISAKFTEIGQMIERGQPVFQLVDLSGLKLTVNVSESDVGKLAVGASAQVYIESLRDSFPAEVTALGARAMQGARTFPVELSLEGHAAIRSGMFARVRILAGVDSTSLVIPRAATLPDVGRTVVFVAKHGKAEKISVRILGSAEDQLAVSGLAAGDTIIVTGNQLLTQGSEINLTLQPE